MKLNFILTLLVVFVITDTISQTKLEVIFVDGVCGMCEKRIESNCLNIKGVKMADLVPRIIPFCPSFASIQA